MDAAVAAPECGPRGAVAAADRRTAITSRATFGPTSISGLGVAEVGGVREQCCDNCDRAKLRPHLIPPEFGSSQFGEFAELLVR